MNTVLIEGTLSFLPNDNVVQQQGSAFLFASTPVDKWVRIENGNLVICNNATKKLEEVIQISALVAVNHILSKTTSGFTLVQQIETESRRLVFLTKTREEQSKWIAILTALRGDSQSVPTSFGPSATKTLAMVKEPAIVDDIRKALLEICCLYQVGQLEDIWEGDLKVLGILFQFKELFNHTAKSVVSYQHSIAFHLKDISFKSPRMRVIVPDPSITVNELISNVCRISLKNAEDYEPYKYCLMTSRGVILRGCEPISSYGFGLLFSTWELSISRTEHFEDSETLIQKGVEMKETRFRDLKMKTISTLPTVTFIFPPGTRKDALCKKTMAISVDKQLLPLWQISSLIVEKFAIIDATALSSSSALVFTVVDSDGKNVLVDMDSSLFDLGLGWLFPSLELTFVHSCFTRSLLYLDKCRMPLCDHMWVLMKEKNTSNDELLAMFRYLNEKYIRLETNTKQLSSEIEQLKSPFNRTPPKNVLKVLTNSRNRFPTLYEAFMKYIQSSKDTLRPVLEKANEKLMLRGERVEDEITKNRQEIEFDNISEAELDKQIAELSSKIAATEQKFALEEKKREDELKNAENTLSVQKNEAEKLKESVSKAQSLFVSQSANENTETSVDLAMITSLQRELSSLCSRYQTLLSECNIAENDLSTNESEILLRKETEDEIKAQLSDAADALEKSAYEIKSLVTAQYFDQEQNKTELKALKDKADLLISATNKAISEAFVQRWLAIDILNDNRLLEAQTDYLNAKISSFTQGITEERTRIVFTMYEEKTQNAVKGELNEALTTITKARDTLLRTSVDPNQAKIATTLLPSLQTKCDIIANEGEAITF